MPASGYVAVLVIDLHFPEAGSLKGKRKELSSIKAQLHGRLAARSTNYSSQEFTQVRVVPDHHDCCLPGVLFEEPSKVYESGAGPERIVDLQFAFVA